MGKNIPEKMGNIKPELTIRKNDNATYIFWPIIPAF
jgi:hypothetical protein